MLRTSKFAAGLIALTLGAAWPGFAIGQDDDALKKLLEKIEPNGPDAAEEPNPTADGSKPAAEQKKDKGLDSMLEKLGIREERPETSGRVPKAGSPDPRPDSIKPEDQDLDAHLRRLIGRIDPKKDQDEEEQGQSGGPMAETMKKMREVEQRLTKLDTGEQTREEQQEIVKSLDQVLERIQKMRQEQRQQQSGEKDPTKMAGQQRGQQDQPGDPSSPEGGGAPPMKPKLPDQPTGLTSAKDTWGHLQGSMREVIDNVSRMMPLEGKKELVDRYFLSVAKRSVARSGGAE